MIERKDAQSWIQEAQKNPESAVDLIRTLAERLMFLDKQNEELRAELIALRRQKITVAAPASGEFTALQKRIQELESALSDTGDVRRALLYARERIEANLPLQAALDSGIGRPLPIDLQLLICKPGSSLLIITEDARAFSVTLGDLPVPQDDAPAALGNPTNVAAILDPATFDGGRFIVLLSQRGYVYSLLLGTVVQTAKKGEKLLRNLIPDDPIVAAIPSYNADVIAISQKGRWTRFPEKAIAGVGSPALELPKGDIVAGIASLQTDTKITILTAEGKLFVRESSQLATKRMSGGPGGVLLKGFTVFGVTTAPEFLVLTRRGKLLSVTVADLPYRTQTDTGATIPGLESDDAALSFTRI